MRRSVTVGLLLLSGINAYAQRPPAGARPLVLNPVEIRGLPAGSDKFRNTPVYFPAGNPDSSQNGAETPSAAPALAPYLPDPPPSPFVPASSQPGQDPPTISRERARQEHADQISAQAHFFIALKDLVCTGIAYWVQGDTLHYITSSGSHNQVSLALVDRTTSQKLNAGRLVDLVLPGTTAGNTKGRRQKETAAGAQGASSEAK